MPFILEQDITLFSIEYWALNIVLKFDIELAPLEAIQQ